MLKILWLCLFVDTVYIIRQKIFEHLHCNKQTSYWFACCNVNAQKFSA